MSATPGVTYRLSDDPEFNVVGNPPIATDERYVLDIDGDSQGITVIHSNERGRQWGEAHARRLLAAGAVETATLDEFPRFAVRGIVEGFYGKPWSLEQRMDMIAFLGSHRMNTFVYSPKDDDYCRRRWHEPYPQSELAALAELVQESGSHAVDVSYGLSPGLSIRYSNQAEVDRLVAKFAQVCELGVRNLQLQLDDIPMQLQHPEDRTRFPDLVTAQVELIDLVRRGLDALDPNIRLAVCPTLYNGRGDEPYLATLGARTDPRVDLLWTGRAICSPELDLADAATFLRTTSRPVLYWDNYPVNDVAMTAELHLGAYRGRDPHLYRFARGVLANPMERPESSKIALATIADYLWDPEGYDPDEQLGCCDQRGCRTTRCRSPAAVCGQRTNLLPRGGRLPHVVRSTPDAGVRERVRRSRSRSRRAVPTGTAIRRCSRPTPGGRRGESGAGCRDSALGRGVLSWQQPTAGHGPRRARVNDCARLAPASDGLR